MEFVVTFLVMFGVIAAMAVGVMRGRAPIKGSCGGIGGGQCACKDPCAKRQTSSQ